MANRLDILGQFSSALRTRASTAQGMVTAVQLPGGGHATATIWRPDLLVASEQSLPKRDKFDIVLPGETKSEATLAGRDPGTNIALLRLAQPVVVPPSTEVDAELGSLALAFGADGGGRATARMGVVNFVGPEWYSDAGGRIDRRVVLDIRLGPTEEGGPVVDAAGGRLGITTFGPRKRVLVIPSDTVEAVIPMLLQHGRVPRGWLGVAFQAVAIPDPLQSKAGQSSGLMVLSAVDGGPASKAGVKAGDIVLSLDGAPATRVRKLIPRLGSESVGRTINIGLLRGEGLVTVQALVEARPVE